MDVVEGYQTGRVTHTNWRVTKIVTLDQLEEVIPNNYLATKVFTNYNRPNALYRESVSIILGYDVTAHKAERVLLGAAKHVREVSEQPLKPDVRMGNFTPQGIEWKLRFWLTDYEKASGVTYQVQKAIARNLHFAGLEPPPEKHSVIMQEDERKMQESDISHILGSIEIFQPLMPAELEYLAQVARRRLLLRGENAVIEKEQGNSLFIVAEGLMTVFITQADRQVIEVANIVSGKIFGEMSLLTGAPRAATVRAEVDSVVYEVDKNHLQTLLINRPDLVNKISQIISARQIENDQNLSKLKPQEITELQQSMTQRLKEKMSQFFKS